MSHVSRKTMINRVAAIVSLGALILAIASALAMQSHIDAMASDRSTPNGVIAQPQQRVSITMAQTANDDADNDGLPDQWEIDHQLNPRDATGDQGATGDPDGDGLINIDEYYNNADPQSADTDGDGLPDLWEVENSLDPADPTGENGNAGDMDGDSVRNGDELVTGTDPTSSDTDQDGVSDGIRFYAAHARTAYDDEAIEAPDGEIFRVGAPR